MGKHAIQGTKTFFAYGAIFQLVSVSHALLLASASCSTTYNHLQHKYTQVVFSRCVTGNSQLGVTRDHFIKTAVKESLLQGTGVGWGHNQC